jgi:Heavy metal binding domain
MDPDYRASKPGICPRCGMKLSLKVPERLEYPLKLSHSPDVIRVGQPVTLKLQVLDPATQRVATKFEVVHEKLMHLFLVSQNLQYFAHEHPVPQADGSFELAVSVPYGGMYRVLGDYYPAGGVPQLAVDTFYAAGDTKDVAIEPSLAPSRAQNLTASLRLEPEQPLAGLETKFFFTLDPGTDLQLYLGAWGHMLIASSDLIDLLHLHPFLADGGPQAQFNVIFPRPGLYRVWTQFQRSGVVNTTSFTIPVAAL